MPIDNSSYKQHAGQMEATSTEVLSSMDPLTQVREVLARASALAGEVVEVVNRMAGAIPEPVSNDTKPEHTSGVINDVAGHARRVDMELKRAFEHMSRLKRLLVIDI